MARPKITIDPVQVQRLASLGCPTTDIAYVLNCSVDTLDRRFADEIAKGKATLRTRLRQKMWESVDKGSVAMQIFLSKQYLGFTDKITTEDVSETPKQYLTASELTEMVLIIRKLKSEKEKQEGKLVSGSEQ